MFGSSRGRVVVPLVLALVTLVPAIRSATIAAPLTDRATTLQTARAVAEKAGMATPPAAVGNARRIADAWLVGQISTDAIRDLDADGLADLLVVQDNAARTSTAVTLRHGSDGHVVWTKTVPYLVGITPMSVGAPARPGLIVSRLEFTAGSVQDTVTYVLTAYDGRTGANLWTWRQAGARVVRILPAYDGRAGRLAVMFGNGQLSFLSAATGATRNAGSRLSYDEVWVDGGDIDGDGYADLVTSKATPWGMASPDVIVPGIPLLTDETVVVHDPLAPPLVALSSASGRVLWEGAHIRRSVRQVLRHTGADRSVDIVFGYCSVRETDEGDCVTWTNTAVESRTGKARWTLPTDGSVPAPFQPMSDVDGDHVQDVLMLNSVVSGRTGQVIWVRASSSPTTCWVNIDEQSDWPSSDDPADVPLPLRSDAQPDGVPELTGDSSPKLAGECGDDTTVLINGRTGAMTATPAYLGQALSGAVDGRGEDFLRRLDTGTDRDVLVQAVDGRTFGSLWTFQYHATYHAEIFSAYAAALNADTKADVVLPLGEFGGGPKWDVIHELVFVDGATGQQLWVLPLNSASP